MSLYGLSDASQLGFQCLQRLLVDQWRLVVSAWQGEFFEQAIGLGFVATCQPVEGKVELRPGVCGRQLCSLQCGELGKIKLTGQHMRIGKIAQHAGIGRVKFACHLQLCNRLGVLSLASVQQTQATPCARHCAVVMSGQQLSICLSCQLVLVGIA